MLNQNCSNEQKVKVVNVEIEKILCSLENWKSDKHPKESRPLILVHGLSGSICAELVAQIKRRRHETTDCLWPEEFGGRFCPGYSAKNLRTGQAQFYSGVKVGRLRISRRFIMVDGVRTWTRRTPGHQYYYSTLTPFSLMYRKTETGWMYNAQALMYGTDRSLFKRPGNNPWENLLRLCLRTP